MNTTDNILNINQIAPDLSIRDTVSCQECAAAEKTIELESMVRYLAKELNVDLSDLLNEGDANKSSQL